MSIRCKQVQDALAGNREMQEEFDADLEAVLQEHLSECESCSEIEVALSMLDDQFLAMPGLEPPDALVSQLMSAAQLESKPSLKVVRESTLFDNSDNISELPQRPRRTSAVGIGGMLVAAAGIALVATSTWSGSSSDSKASKTVATIQKPMNSRDTTVSSQSTIVEDPKSPDTLQKKEVWKALDDRSALAAFETTTTETVTNGIEVKGKSEAAQGFFNGSGDQILSPAPPLGNVFLSIKKTDPEDSSDSFHFRQRIEGESSDSTRDGQSARKRISREQIAQDSAIEHARNSGVLGLFSNPNSKVAFASGEQEVDFHRGLDEAGNGDKGRKNESDNTNSDIKRDEVDRLSAKDGKKKANKSFASSIDTGVGTKSPGLFWRNNESRRTVDLDGDQKSKDGEEDQSELRLAAGQHAAGIVDQDKRSNQPASFGKLGQMEEEKLRVPAEVVEKKVLRNVAQAFLAEKEDVSVATIASNGFWSNNYIPDSPELRLLASRLANDPSEAEYGSLDSDFSPYEPKLDAPRNSALGISVRSDRRVTDGPTRMRLQVGIKGTAKKPGRRASLNIGVVLDLAGQTSSKQTQESIRKLLKSLRTAKQSGDRFSLTIANAPGGLLLTPKEFRSGPLTVAMRDLFSGGVSEKLAAEPTLGLAEAVLQATEQVSLDDDPSAPLGRSSVLLVTASAATRADHQGLLQLAQANTSKGIGFSAIGIGNGVNDAQLTALARAGHGHRRLLLQAAEASSLIADTLADAESVVARALRVRVQLAPGVKLVEVVGSDRLDAATARRTRAAEQSIDKRIDRAQGIKSDREEDEEGIKIIIPSFSAGESHVILLDVIVPGPGAVADVSVSYKDLVHLRNGKSKTSLSLARGTRAPGQNKLGSLERGVFRNYVGLEIGQGLKTSGRLLGTGQSAAAHAALMKLHTLLLGLRQEYSWLQQDAVFGRDLRAVQRFRDLLSKIDSVSSSSQNYIAHSLNYSGWRKVVQAPVVNNTPR